MDNQPAQAEASPSERSDLLRQLVPGPWSTDLVSASSSPSADSELRTPHSALDLTVHDPHPNRPQLPDVHTLEDVNADFFD